MLNVTALNGRLTATPELKKTQSGLSVTSFSIAVERNSKGANGEKVTDFFNCVAWRNTADFISSYFEKGSLIAITGELQNRSYTDSNGNKRTVTEIIVNQVSFCGNKKQETERDDGEYPAADDFVPSTANDDDLPF